MSFVKTSSSRPQSSGVMRELAVAMREFCIHSETGGSHWLLEGDKKDDGWMDPGTPTPWSLGISWQPFLGT